MCYFLGYSTEHKGYVVMHADTGRIINGCWDLFIVPNSFPLAEARDNRTARKRAAVGELNLPDTPAQPQSPLALNEYEEDDLQVGGNKNHPMTPEEALGDSSPSPEEAHQGRSRAHGEPLGHHGFGSQQQPTVRRAL